MTNAKHRVLCVDDHAFLAEGLAHRLSMEPDMACVGSATNADDLIHAVERSGANVVLLDIEMPGCDPFEAMEDLHRLHPEVKAIILTAHVRDSYLDAAAQAGAWGYLSKSDKPDEIINAIRRAVSGEFVMSRHVSARCGSSAERLQARANSRLHSLTPREMEVLRLIGRGMTRSAIADAMHRSPKTIDTHRMSIMEKLNIHDRGELVRFAIREGLAEID